MDLKQIKEKLERLKNGGRKVTGFWKVPEGESIVRICPNPKHGGDSLLEFFMHYNIGGKGNTFLCSKRNFQEKCPICDFASILWEEGGDSIKLAKDLFAKQRFYSPVLVRGEEKEGIRWWSYSKTTYETILKLMDNPDYGDITDPETGTDLIINYGTPKGKLFPDTGIQPRRKSSTFCDDLGKDECMAMIENMPDITDMLDRKSFEEIKGIIDQYIASTGNDKDVESVSKEQEKYGEGKKEEEKSSIDKAFDELGV